MKTQDESRELSHGAGVQPVEEMVGVAISMAERHLSEIVRHRKHVETDQHGYRNHPDYVYANVTLHSRAFLWELVAAFDLTLFWMKERFNLDLDAQRSRGPRWRQSAKIADPKCAAAFAEVGQTHGSDWFSAVTRYRNYAHRNFIFTQGLLTESQDPQILWPRAIEGTPYLEDLTIILTRYLDNFKAYVARLTPLMAQSEHTEKAASETV